MYIFSFMHITSIYSIELNIHACPGPLTVFGFLFPFASYAGEIYRVGKTLTSAVCSGRSSVGVTVCTYSTFCRRLVERHLTRSLTTRRIGFQFKFLYISPTTEARLKSSRRVSQPCCPLLRHGKFKVTISGTEFSCFGWTSGKQREPDC